MTSVGHLEALLKKIVDGVAPEKFTIEHLKSIGFTSSADRGFIPLLKDLGFLTSDGAPTPRYNAYRDRSRSKLVLGEALRDAYEDVFHIREFPTESDRAAIEGLFKSKQNSTDRVSQLQAMTFLALLKNADVTTSAASQSSLQASDLAAVGLPTVSADAAEFDSGDKRRISTELHYTIQIHLPATKDIEVLHAIFRSLRENLLS